MEGSSLVVVMCPSAPASSLMCPPMLSGLFRRMSKVSKKSARHADPGSGSATLFQSMKFLDFWWVIFASLVPGPDPNTHIMGLFVGSE
jgi:hypothetical protein